MEKNNCPAVHLDGMDWYTNFIFKCLKFVINNNFIKLSPFLLLFAAKMLPKIKLNSKFTEIWEFQLKIGMLIPALHSNINCKI